MGPHDAYIEYSCRYYMLATCRSSILDTLKHVVDPPGGARPEFLQPAAASRARCDCEMERARARIAGSQDPKSASGRRSAAGTAALGTAPCWPPSAGASLRRSSSVGCRLCGGCGCGVWCGTYLVVSVSSIGSSRIWSTGTGSFSSRIFLEIDFFGKSKASLVDTIRNKRARDQPRQHAHARVPR